MRVEASKCLLLLHSTPQTAASIRMTICPHARVAEDADRRDEHLRRLLRCKRENVNNHIGMFCSPYDPGIGPMLCLPRDEVHARIHKLVSGISIIYGLVLSGVAKSALSPFDVENEFVDDAYKRALGNFYNFAATVQFTLCLSGSLFSTIIFIIVSYQPDSSIYRIAAHFDFFLAYCYMIFYSTYGGKTEGEGI